ELGALAPRRLGLEPGGEVRHVPPHLVDRLPQLLDMRVVDEPAVLRRDVVAGWPPEDLPVVEQPHAVVVEENEGVVLDVDAARRLPHVVLGDVPGGKAATLVAEDVDSRESFGPVVEVLLVAELAVLEPVVAPLDAAVVPPVQGLEASPVPAKGEE